MKLQYISLAVLLGMGTFTSCSDSKLDLSNPNQQTSSTFGKTVEELEEVVVGAYNNIRREGTFARVGYVHDAVRGDEVWNAAQSWFLATDNFNAATTDEVVCSWIWRDWFYVINKCNYAATAAAETYGTDDSQLSEKVQRIKGQALFLRGLSYYMLAGYYQNAPIITDYNDYSDISKLYPTIKSYDEVLDQAEADLKEAKTLLPTKKIGGEWSTGRATSGAAAGVYARVLMMRHKYQEAYTELKEIIDGVHGSYSLMANYGDNFRETSAYENNNESIFEVQFMDYGKQGTDEEWTPVNTSIKATQAHAVESNFCPGKFGGWADLSASPWLYNLYKSARTTSGNLDPRLYWTLCTYEPEWEGYENGNVAYTQKIAASDTLFTNTANGGIPVAKYTNARTGLYSNVVTGLKCGINIRYMRYSDVLLRAAECINEIKGGPDAEAIGYVNQVRTRAGLRELKLDADGFQGNADKFFEQIANVERPREFGCEHGRGFDLIRWGFFYDDARMTQMKQHAVARVSIKHKPTDALNYDDINTDNTLRCSFDYYTQGHEFFPIYQTNLNDNVNLGSGNSANTNTSNKSYYFGKGWTVHPVVSDVVLD